ncbi:MAG TPA: BadM/Rrf2 family transcriptional regulator [Rhodocyclaceae bacterium]|nr:MAG: BadM/Rrf2 family transcriptional regulator [Betaproteobacteria bacterium CG2_30_68_42]PIX74024.1 MAG: BadM/Rrf2 family transcriptional regulator [Rhodocyclales bacterium CG_4_10_14_3_um_filter_68_10]PJA57899.1 MAG: BadM/Rrf2 family transcriptional regulator [Rhodocyclales bacterium CG_4_9_14_3_um_filter_68_10]HCX32598.1 BadM/Rrf2 family transcriptional regulator [Rhodocyclaceae bacterium]
MRLTTFTDYTLRVLMYLALEPGHLATVPEIASAYGISENHLVKVVHRLARGGVIESIRGKGGGVRLACDPREIRLGRIVRAAETDAAIVECLAPASNTCRITRACRLAPILLEAFDALYETLDAYTLADLVANRKAIRRALA